MVAPAIPPSSKGAAGGDGGALSFMQMELKGALSTTFKLQMRYPVDVDG